MEYDIKSIAIYTIIATLIAIFWYRWWDSNPHGFPPDFESGASTNSATSAFYFFIVYK